MIMVSISCINALDIVDVQSVVLSQYDTGLNERMGSCVFNIQVIII